MSRPALHEDVEHEVRKSWAQDPFQTADQVWRSVRIENERGKWFPSLRKVQYIVRDAKQARPHMADEPELELWGPDWPDDSEDIACLLRLKLQSLKHPEMPLTTRVGKWALRLRAGFLGPMEDPTVDPDLELLCFAYEYTLRERVAELFQDGLYTPDLDGAMMCRPWESVERLHQYQRSVAAGLFPAHRPARLFHHIVQAASVGWEEVIGAIRASSFLALNAELNKALSDKARTAAHNRREQLELLSAEIRTRLEEAGPAQMWDQKTEEVVRTVLERSDNGRSSSLSDVASRQNQG